MYIIWFNNRCECAHKKCTNYYIPTRDLWLTAATSHTHTHVHASFCALFVERVFLVVYAFFFMAIRSRVPGAVFARLTRWEALRRNLWTSDKVNIINTRVCVCVCCVISVPSVVMSKWLGCGIFLCVHGHL